MEEKEMHLVKKVSKELGLTYKELGEKIGYSESILRQSVSGNKLSKQLEKTLELYIKTLELEEKLDKNEKSKKSLKELLKEAMKEINE